MWKLIARLRGWREAWDYDEHLLVVWHAGKRIHYSGEDAWRHAALHRNSRTISP